MVTCCKQQQDGGLLSKRGAILVLVWSALIHSLSLYDYFAAAPAGLCPSNARYLHAIAGVYAVSLLLYPLLGYLGEVVLTKYKVMLFGLVMFLLVAPAFILVGVIMAVLLLIHGTVELTALFAVLFLALVGIATFESNAIQFGVDQLDFANSKVISNFIHLYFWTTYLPTTIFLVCMSVLAVGQAGILAFFGLPVVTATTVVLVCCCRRHLERDPTNKTNPVRLIWAVTNFARKHKEPVGRRSAFTYTEAPSRLDLAKTRFGGRFTSEQVEDVKSFWHIFFVLLSLFGFLLKDSSASAALQYLNHNHLFNRKGNITDLYILVPDDMRLVFSNTTMASAITVFLGLPCFHLLFRLFPAVKRCLPNMLNKMLLGLVLVFLSVSLTSALSWMVTQTEPLLSPGTGDTCEIGPQSESGSASGSAEFSFQLPRLFFLVYLVPQVLNGLSEMLVFLTALEFILAQAPHSVQGFIIGLWYAMKSGNVFISILQTATSLGHYWWFYATKAGVVLFSIVAFCISARKYKYRQRNEYVDINANIIVQEYAARDIERRIAYEEEEESDKSSSLSDESTESDCSAIKFQLN